MDTYQISQDKSSVQFFFTAFQFFCIFNNRNRNSNSLISAPGIDDDGKFASIHTCIRPCSCFGNGAVFDRVPKNSKVGFADIGSIRFCKSFFSNCHIAADLFFNELIHIVQLDPICEIKDSLYCHEISAFHGFF